LALQEHCASHMKPIQLLDEVDVGISGHVAEQVAQLLYKRSKNHQIIAISHLPQMAMMADQHGYICKGVKNDQACIQFKWLNDKERVDGLAELLAGKKINDAARDNAQQLLMSADIEKKALV
jgi:DNA repair protein RecN (Recombination protein N)